MATVECGITQLTIVVKSFEYPIDLMKSQCWGFVIIDRSTHFRVVHIFFGAESDNFVISRHQLFMSHDYLPLVEEV